MITAIEIIERLMCFLDINHPVNDGWCLACGYAVDSRGVAYEQYTPDTGYWSY